MVKVASYSLLRVFFGNYAKIGISAYMKNFEIVVR
jgi:hypothetical protein